MKRFLVVALALFISLCSFAQNGLPTVYFTREITPSSLVKIFDALGMEMDGNVAVKISTGEPGGNHYLKPEFISELVRKVDGTIVECNTAYPGRRNTFEAHWKVMEEHGFKVFKCDIMDEAGDLSIPMKDTKHLKENIVGANLANYDYMINLAHFKGHAMGGFGGVLKNQSIGIASANGKTYIHTAGKTKSPAEMWANLSAQDHFLEAMAGAAQAVHEYMKAKIVYINVMNNMSVDCDCDSHPAEPMVKDMGIIASLDPVAADQACLDKVFGHESVTGDDARPLIERITRQHGTHITEYAEQIGLGSRKYNLVELK